MSKELVISSNRHETRVAMLEDDQLVEVYFQRANEYSLAGSIHKGRVTRVLPGMQSAFVDLGLERDTFLYVSDFFEEHEDYDRLSTKDERPLRQDVTRRDPNRGERRAPEAAPAKAPEPAAEAQPVIAGPAPNGEPAAPAGAENREARDGRDRDRGRRSRRRRRGGRGFPESKYAADVPAGTAQEEPEEEEAPREIFLLPGESLAKYSRSENGSEEESGEEALEEAAPIRAAEFPHASAATPEPNIDLANEEAEAEPESTMAPPVPETEAEPAAEPEITETEATAASGRAESASVAEPEEESSETLSDEPVDEEAARLIESFLSEGRADDAAKAVLGSGTDAGELEEDAETETEFETETAEETEKPISAAVREQSGGRFLHRGGRGMRRRRGRGGRGEQQHGEQHAVEEAPAPQREARPPKEDRGGRAPQPSITDLLKEGQEIIVQIAKEPLGQKGARITSHIALPGRYVVYMPSLDHLGVSRKIDSDEERQRLKRILQGNITGITGGFIVRTAGEGKTEQEIAADMAFLYNLWLDIRQKAEKRPAPLLLHHDLDIVQRTLRDQLTEEFKAIWVDNEELYESVLRFVQRFQPTLVSKVKLYTRDTPIFDAFNITAELEKALRPKVWLKSGGYIVINQTEALVAIDINTGKYVGKSNRLEDTIVKTNTEAVKEIVRQIRLRDLGGIIVVDFIDMDERKNRQKVMQALEEAMRADRAPYKILQFNDFGLVAITRKRVKQSLERTLCAPCPTCEGAGYVKSPQTVITEILQEAQKLRKVVEGSDVMLRASPDVVKLLKSTGNKYLEELEEILARPVLVKSDSNLHPEKFDLA